MFSLLHKITHLLQSRDVSNSSVSTGLPVPSVFLWLDCDSRNGVVIQALSITLFTVPQGTGTTVAEAHSLSLYLGPATLHVLAEFQSITVFQWVGEHHTSSYVYHNSILLGALNCATVA